jgi:hypothetical protein
MDGKVQMVSGGPYASLFSLPLRTGTFPRLEGLSELSLDADKGAAPLLPAGRRTKSEQFFVWLSVTDDLNPLCNCRPAASASTMSRYSVIAMMGRAKVLPAVKAPGRGWPKRQGGGRHSPAPSQNCILLLAQK